MRQFFDTNVLVYAHDGHEQGKRDAARSLVEGAMAADDFVVSTQVLVEFYSTAIRRKLLAPADALRFVRLWSEHDTVGHTADLMLRGIELHQEHSLSLWDALIVQAALDARCAVLLSEDLQHARRFGDLEVRNPFIAAGAHEPGAASHGSRRVSKRRR